MSSADQDALVQSLRNPRAFGKATASVSVLETHISYVFLTGHYAYKIRKAVNLEFLDFTTLDRRRHDCEEEVRLNQPLAPSIYLGVVPITGTIAAPVVGGEGTAIEYAVKMRQFARDSLLSDLLARGALTAAHIDQLAATVAAFHERTARVPADLPYGHPDDVLRPALQNFEQLLAETNDPEERADLEGWQAWTVAEHTARASIMARRRTEGFVRECHGDLHLGNIALVDGQVTLFDRLEFNPSFRWIDVINDVAFVVMDLEERSRPDLAARFLTAYLEATGDYDGLAVLRFYAVYRSIVRAKVARLRVDQLESPADRDTLMAEYRAYLDLARRLRQPAAAAIFITHGLPGSGKSSCAQAVVERTGAVRVRTDVERKRLHGLDAHAASRSPVGAGLYTEEATERTYTRARALAGSIVAAGYLAVVDGAFLRRAQRQLIQDAAAAAHVRFGILSMTAPVAELRARIIQRNQEGEDASEATLAVLDQQRETAEPLTDDEQPFVIECDTARSSAAQCAEAAAKRLEARPIPS